MSNSSYVQLSLMFRNLQKCAFFDSLFFTGLALRGPSW